MTAIDRPHDWLIVGGGSAGCVLAARLSEDPATSVLLVEAGPDWRPDDAPVEVRSLNPSRVIGVEKFDELQWPDLRASRVAGQPRRLFWRGRGLGGSSTINGIIAIRPVPDDWDRWGQAAWTHDAVLPSLCRLEDDVDFGGEPHHGSGGPLPVFRIPDDEWGPVDAALWHAARSAGHPACADHNAPGGTGVSPYAVNADPVTRQRVTVNDAYLDPVRDRPNLTVLAGTLVDRVLFDGAGRAVGVRARVDGAWRTLEAGEVVLSAGAVHSPAVLLRSGVGPRTGLPVGEGLQDHANAVLFLDYRDGAGPATADDRHTNVCVRYASGLEGAGDNDMMLVSMNHSPRSTAGGLLIAWVNQAFSRGRLRLASDDPDDHPVIDEEMLSDGRDLRRLRDATRRMVEMVRGPAFDAVVARAAIDPAGTPLDVIDTDGAIDEWLSATSSDAQHVCATAAMGSVVDAECRVLGHEGLRVVDASVFPEVPRANTHLMVLALAERFSEMVRSG